MPSLYVVNPRPRYPVYYGVDTIAEATGTRVAAVADLTVVTVAALAAPYLQVSVADENIEPVDLELRPDWVALTGKYNQGQRMIELAAHYRGHGCKVIMGGAFTTLAKDRLREHCDVLLEGELEAIAPELFSDLAGGTFRSAYDGGRPPLELSPVPRWDLYPNERAMIGAVQTSRGCPFTCEFCDVIMFLGRTQRFKPIASVLAELDVLYASGYRRVIFSDDNLTVNRPRCKELLQAVADWNDRRSAGRVTFLTQGSIEAAKDTELLRMCARAGLQNIFIGLETPNQEALVETKKGQNVGFDLTRRLETYVEHSVSLDCGCVLGFDADGPDIVDVHRSFWSGTPVPNIVVNNLLAIESTPLYERMKRDGRLVEHTLETSHPWHSNIVPLWGGREEGEARVRQVFGELYDPDAFGERLQLFCERFGTAYDPGISHTAPDRLTLAQRLSLKTLNTLRRRGPRYAALWQRVQALSNRHPRASQFLSPALIQFLQAHLILDMFPLPIGAA